MSTDKIVFKSKALVEIYSSDLDEAFIDEFLLFSRVFVDSKCKSVAEMIRVQIDDKRVTSFPNVHITFRIYLSIFRINCEGERSFSKLKIIKNYPRSPMGQARLPSLVLSSVLEPVRSGSREPLIQKRGA